MILENLTAQQLEIVKCNDNVIVQACPGSGKTRVLTRKAAFELSRLDSNKNFIAALTFTNLAAEEIKERIDALNIETNNFWAGTIHSFCLDWILRPYSPFSKHINKGFKIADQYYTEQLMSELKKKYGFGFWDDINTRFTKDSKFETQNQKEIQLLKDYYRKIKGEGYINFDLILLLSYQIIVQNPFIAKILSNIFIWLLIDEYQDTQDLQYQIIHSIIKAGKTNILYVGDPNQAIYSSIGGIAKPKEIIESEINASLKSLPLTGNYRSHQRMINFYSSFQIINNKITALGANKSESGSIKYFTQTHTNNLIDLLCDLINENIKTLPFNEICILAPQWSLLFKLGRELKSKLPNVPFNAPGLTPIRRDFDSIWYKLTRLLLTDPHPNYYFTRVRWANEIIHELEIYTNSIFDKETVNAKFILKTINSIRFTETDGIRYLELAFIKFFQLLSINIDDFDKLKSSFTGFFADAFDRLKKNQGLAISDIQSFRDMFRSKNGIVIQSCHAAKGQEFDTVITFGILDGYIPHSKNSNSDDAKRLLYVIASRARKNLYLISEIGRNGRDKPTNELVKINFNYD